MLARQARRLSYVLTLGPHNSAFPVTFLDERLRNEVKGHNLHQNKPKQEKKT
jgi:hypothetical protein